jgi:hypothetical protein
LTGIELFASDCVPASRVTLAGAEKGKVPIAKNSSIHSALAQLLLGRWSGGSEERVPATLTERSEPGLPTRPVLTRREAAP